jgi:hypothetical protein
LRAELKRFAKEQGWGARVRVNASGCLGRCEEGIAAVLYPQSEWFTELTPESGLPRLKAALTRALSGGGK